MGLDLGLERTGRFRLLACVERVPAFCETIDVNLNAGRIHSSKPQVYQTDIVQLESNRLLADLGIRAGEIDAVVGGPPCQAFSVFGKRRGLSDERGQLILEFIRLVKDLRPRAFLMENVRGLLSIKSAASARKGSLFARVQEQFNALGYRTDCFVVNSVNYGAPQIRERVLLFGNRHNLLADFLPPTHSDRPEDNLLPFATLGDALRGKPDLDPTVLHFSARKQMYLAMVPPGGNWRSLPLEVQKESMGKSFYLKGGRSAHWRKLSYDFPCPTIMTLPNHAGTSMCHPELLRPLTIGECARVQGFPDDWVFAGTAAEKYQQVGNAVPLVLAEIAGTVLATMLERTVTQQQDAAAPSWPNRVVHLRPHVRTRCWWKDGEIFGTLPYAQRPKRKKDGRQEPTLFDALSTASEE